MKRTSILLGLIVAFLAIFSTPGFAQERVTEKKILGTWKLIIDIDEAMEEAQEELDEEDDWLGRAIVQGVSGLVGGIMDNIDIYFDFHRDGELEIYVEAFGEGETEYATWEIRNGQLYIYEESDNIDFGDEDDYWMFDGDILIAFEEGRYEDEREENVYMVRVD